MNDGLPAVFLHDVERLSLQSGDVLLVTLDAHADSGMLSHIHHVLSERFQAQGLEVLIFFKSPALKIEILRFQPGDVLVVTEGPPITAEGQAKIRQMLPAPVFFRTPGTRLDKLDIRQMNAGNWWHGDQFGEGQVPHAG